MNTTIRRVLTANSLSRKLYFAARQAYRIHQTAKVAGRCFLNVDEFKSALGSHGTEEVDLRTVDGLTITIRKNYGDAMTLVEILLDDFYVRDLNLPRNPVVIDIGGFFRGFSFYPGKTPNRTRAVRFRAPPRERALIPQKIAQHTHTGAVEPGRTAST